MKNIHDAPRRERLRVRLTEQEAASIEAFAASRGLTVSDFVRTALLRKATQRFGRRVISAAEAERIRKLRAIGGTLQQLVDDVGIGRLARQELTECLALVRDAIIDGKP